MSSNPFLATKVNTLKEAFPTIENTVIENTLWLENGNMDQAFERLLATTDPSAAAPTTHVPPSPPRTTATTTNTTNNPRIRPPAVSCQQRPLPPAAPAKPGFQSVREELAQWRQELANDQDMRRTSRRSQRRNQPHSSLRSSGASNYELQSNNYRDFYSLTNVVNDAVNEGRTAALKAATSIYDRFITANSVYGNPFLSSSTSSSSSSSSTGAVYEYPQNSYTTHDLYSRSSATISSSSRPYNNNRNNVSSSMSRNRPLPRPPQSTQQNHVIAQNPFDSSEHAESLPPPTYEAREHDTLIDPMEADRLLLHTSSHTS